MSAPKESIEDLVRADLKAGKSYREICESRHVAPKTIKRIKDGDAEVGKGEIAAQAFELFEKNEKLTAVVIKLKQPPELIQQLYARWAEMEQLLLVPKPDKDEMMRVLNSIGYASHDLPTLKSSIQALVSDNQAWNKFTYPCSTCGNPIRLVDTPDALSKIPLWPWQHPGQCFEKAKSTEQVIPRTVP